MSWTPPPPEVVPPGFKPTGDVNTPGTTFTHPDTGVSVHWGGTQWVDDASGGPFNHSYDMFSGTTAYQDPKTGKWDVHMPPPGFNIDWNVPPESVGYYWFNKQRRIYFSPGSGVWIDAATGQAIPPTTQERTGTGDDAGRVDVPDDEEGPLPLTPEDDSPDDTLAKNSIASSRLLALMHGSLKVPHGTVAKDYKADVDNLRDSVALRQRMIKEGASSTEIAIVDGHIADLLAYLKLWKSKGGATAVNEQAQIDDLASQVGMLTKIVEQGVQTAGGELGGHMGKFIDARGIGGGGSQTVVPKHQTAKSYVGKGAGTATGQGSPGQATPAKGKSGAANPAGADTLPLPVEEPARAGSETLPLPVESPVRAGSETADLGTGSSAAQGKLKSGTYKGTGTDAGRPSTGQLDDAQADAMARQDAYKRALEKAAIKSGFKGGAAELAAFELNEKIQANIKRNYVLAKENPRDSYGYKPGDSLEGGAARYARQHSLDGTKYDPAKLATNMTTHLREVEEIATGKSPTVKSTRQNLQTMHEWLKAAEAAVREGEAKFPDYWERMDDFTKGVLQKALDGAKGKDLNYWQSKMDGAPPATSQPAPAADTKIVKPPLEPKSEQKTRKFGGTTALLATSMVVVVLIAAVGANILNQKPAAAPGDSSVAAAETEEPDESVGGGGGGGQAACAPAQFLANLVASATQAVLNEVCSRQMMDKTGDRTEYDGTAATVKAAVGDMKSIADPEITLSADDAAALAKDCHVLDLSGAAPTGAAGPIPSGRWCTSTGPAAGTYEVYIVELTSPIASDPDGNWEAGLGFKTGTTATWDSSAADPLTGHNRYVTLRFGTHSDVYGPFVGAWSGKQGEFFTDQPTGSFAAIDGTFIAMFIPSAEWTNAEACRWFTYYGRTDNTGGGVDLWPDLGQPETTC